MAEPVQKLAGDRPRVLIVEDNPADAELAVLYLAPKYAVFVADHIHAAVAMLRKMVFEAVLTDLTLPDAIELEAVIKLQAAAPEAALIVVTGLADEVIGHRAVQLGAQDYLVKGHFEGDVLDRAMRYAIERKRVEKRLAQLAHYDQLTGLANRATFRDRLQMVLERARRKNGRFTVMYVDLNDFKATNDCFGHDIGDAVLREVADRLRHAIRSYDTAARLGGDEFALLLDHQGDEITPRQLIERVLAAFATPIELGGEPLNVTASIGVATFPEAGNNEAELLKAADTAMFWAKDRPGTSCVVYDQAHAEEALPRRRSEVLLRQAFAAGEFVLQFQPVVSLRNQRVTAVEALLRWSQRDGTLVGPSSFIPNLEATGLIVDVGAWVIREACRNAAQWRRDGHDLRVAVNISARQFESEGLMDTVEAALREHGVPPGSLEVEITESLLMRDTAQTKRALRGLKELGVRISIDDFGTGYSSLAYLHRFSVDALKIDRSFVSRLEENEGAVLTSAIIRLGHNLGLEVVAEGVETSAQLQKLCNDGCDFGQGYFLGRPAFDWARSAELAAEGG
ncbi:MAG: GGDEF domain-containing response regulator [Myxococcales bacterium]|nr:GGDEF domain-containing response regulator [Myxococcales bacterium]